MPPSKPPRSLAITSKTGIPPLPKRPGSGHPLYHYVVTEPHAIATFDFSAQDNDELSLQKGDVIILLQKIDDTWYIGRNDQKKGIFPSNFVRIVKDIGTRQAQSDVPEKMNAEFDKPCAVARFDFDAENENELAFTEGDHITLLNYVGEEWLKGQLNGKIGIFPIDFVHILKDLSEPHDAASANVDSTDSNPINSQFANPNNPSMSDKSLCKAMFDFEGSDDRELSFKAGDILEVTGKIDNEWATGKLNQKDGMFPIAFVDKIPDTLLLVANKEVDVPHCKAVYDFNAEADNELSFRKGDIITIVAKINDEWLEGKLNNRNGIFPTQFVEIIQDLGDNAKSAASNSNFNAKAIYDFDGQDSTELSFKEGEYITVIEKVNDEWLLGEINGQKGQFPIAFVKIFNRQ